MKASDRSNDLAPGGSVGLRQAQHHIRAAVAGVVLLTSGKAATLGLPNRAKDQP